MRDDSNEKSCISFSVREVKPAIKPAKTRVEEETRARPFGPASTGATEGGELAPDCLLRVLGRLFPSEDR